MPTPRRSPASSSAEKTTTTNTETGTDRLAPANGRASLFAFRKNGPVPSGRDNPALRFFICSLILLGARRDSGDLFQDRGLPRGASAVRNACLAADTRPASRNTS